MEWKTNFCLRRFEDRRRSRGTSEVKQAAAAGRDVLVVAGLEAEEAAKFAMASAEPLRQTEALEAAHTLNAIFDAPMNLLRPAVLISAALMNSLPPKRCPNVSRAGAMPVHSHLVGDLVDNRFRRVKEYQVPLIKTHGPNGAVRWI